MVSEQNERVFQTTTDELVKFLGISILMRVAVYKP